MSVRDLKIIFHVKVQLWFKVFIKCIAILHNLHLLRFNKCASVINWIAQKNWCKYRIGKGKWKKLRIAYRIVDSNA